MAVGLLSLALMVPNVEFPPLGIPPPGQPQPGAVGGGGSPSDAGINTASLSLALVPDGLTPVAVFPPFTRFVQNNSFLRQKYKELGCLEFCRFMNVMLSNTI